MKPTPAEIREYLVGAPADEGRERIEEHFFADHSVFDAVVDEMDALCDGFLRGSLETAERERVADLATGGLWAERMTFARALQEVASRTQAQAAPGVGSHRPADEVGVISFVDWVRRRDWKAQLRAAAVLLVMVLGWPVYLWQTRAQRAELAAVRARADQQVASARAEASSTRRDIDSLQAQNAQLALAAQKQVTAEFALMPTFTRGGAAPIEIPSRAVLVRLELALETGVPAGPYRATIVSSSGATVYSAANIAGGGATPVLLVPAPSLAAGDYRLVLRRAGDTDAAAAVAEFGFRVRRR